MYGVLVFEHAENAKTQIKSGSRFAGRWMNAGQNAEKIGQNAGNTLAKSEPMRVTQLKSTDFLRTSALRFVNLLKRSETPFYHTPFYRPRTGL